MVIVISRGDNMSRQLYLLPSHDVMILGVQCQEIVVFVCFRELTDAAENYEIA